MKLVISSIDGCIPTTTEELRAGVGSDWSDDRPMPVFDLDGDANASPVGSVNPFSGTYTPTEDS
ncbi:MAG: hypothetical protein OXC11_14250 [Rhodospirillales bacterium]|nr:hypothetical protein [Rhodospirillales bacterium]